MECKIEDVPTATDRRSGKGRKRDTIRRPSGTGCMSARRAYNHTEEGIAYNDEDREFLMAIDRYKREKRRPHPHWTEVLDVLRSLGWEKRKI